MAKCCSVLLCGTKKCPCVIKVGLIELNTLLTINFYVGVDDLNLTWYDNLLWVPP